MRISWSCGAWLPVLRRLPGADAVALTFDDGPTAESTQAVLAALAEQRATATFFLSGIRAVQHPALVERIVAEGHAVYGHGWEHVQLDREPPDRLPRDLDRAERLLARVRPTPSPYLVRLPYNAGFQRPWVHRAIRAWRADAQLVHWAVSLEDVTIPDDCARNGSAGGATLAQVVARRVRRAMADPLLPGAIVLLHEQPFGVATLHEPVAPGLVRALLAALTAAGLRTAPLLPATHQTWLRRSVLIEA